MPDAYPEFDSETLPSDSKPQQVVLRINHHGGTNAPDSVRILALVMALRLAVVRAIQLINRNWNRNYILRNVKGHLHGTNLTNAATHISTKLTTLIGLNTGIFTDLMAMIHQSNDDVSVTDVEWSFILNQNSIQEGGSPNAKIPSWVPQQFYKDTWEPQKDPRTGEFLNCAAYAIARLTVRKESSINEASRLMKKLRWKQYITIAQIEDYVKDKKTKRIVVIKPQVMSGLQTCFNGENFQLNHNDPKENTIYLVYESSQRHFAATKAPGEIYRKFYNSNRYMWCHKCLQAYDTRNQTCKCEILDSLKLKEEHRRKRAKVECRLCGKLGKHECPSAQCSTCGSIFPRGYERNSGHRCIVFKKESRDPKNSKFAEPGDPEGHYYKLWAYDLESAITRDDTVADMSFHSDGNDDQFKIRNGKVSISYVTKSIHNVNLVVAKDVFDESSERIWFGDKAIQDFLDFMLVHNKGKNICVAHNGSGYDSRLIFDAAIKITGKEPKITTVARGCKIMQLVINKHLIFRDSLLHLKGSLSKLATDYFGASAGLRKGHFPHLFNRKENYNYVGRIPDKKYYDLRFVAKSKDDLKEFHSWYETQKEVPWDFKKELTAYCQNDVKILAALMKEHHTILMDKFGMSPWFNTTSPSYMHEVMLRKLSADLELPERSQNEEYTERIQKLAQDDHWGVLTSNEYWFARLALRGGRTDIRRVLHSVSNEDWNRGVRIRYQDIVSMYPYVQVAREYPIGLPVIEVYDDTTYPCYEHRNPECGNVVRLECECSIEKRRRYSERLSDIREIPLQPTIGQIMNDDFFGIVCASLIPPKNLFHPVLVTWDPESGKCVGHLNPIDRGVFTTPEFKVALQNGYQLVKIHRLDRYKKKEGLWNEIIKDLYIEKMANSEVAPSIQEQERLVNGFEKEFGMGEVVKESFHRWGDNPARKQTFKIMLNSGWGKHCERPNMPEIEVINPENADVLADLWTNIEKGKTQLKEFTVLGDKTFIKHLAIGVSTHPNFHKAYLPAGLFVPAYGRLMLWEQLNKLGDRVLMHDTDSIVYIYDPEKENIPQGNIWGEWDTEKFDYKNGGIKTFVGLCPKSYGMEAANGKTMFKIKGVSIKLAHEELINFNSMKKLVQDHLDGKPIHDIEVPQFTFSYKFGQGISTWNFFKKIAFKPNDLKGKLVGATLYPTGYEI